MDMPPEELEYREALDYFVKNLQANQWEGTYEWFCKTLNLPPAMREAQKKWHAFQEIVEHMLELSAFNLYLLTRKEVRNEQRKSENPAVNIDDTPPCARRAGSQKRNGQNCDGLFPSGNDPK